MLILGRQQGDRIIFTRDGERIELLVHRIRGQQVHIGIDADKSWRILRDELEPLGPSTTERATNEHA